MTFVEIQTPIQDRLSMSLPKPSYNMTSPYKITSLNLGLLKQMSQGSGFISSGTKFVKDEIGQPASYAEIFCYVQSDKLLELVTVTSCDVNGMWEIKNLYKNYLYTIVARYDGFENTICSNIYPM